MAPRSGTRNTPLAEWMRENGVTAGEFAERINQALAQGGPSRGSVSERTVFRWLAGENRSPQRRTRDALEAVTGRSAAELGFVPRRGASVAPPAHDDEEDPLRRRTFISVATGVTVGAVTPMSGARPTLGLADVTRLRERLSELWAVDDQFGGGPVLEERALSLADRTLTMQQNGSATQRVRSRLYAIGAGFMLAAMFAALDARRFAEAQRYLEQSVMLAGLSGDPQIQHQAWRQASQLASQRGRYTDALAAAEVCATTAVHRSDPLYASMSHIRIALAASNLGDQTRALRGLERATTAFDHADPMLNRPASVAFYTVAEIHGLAGLVHYRLGAADRSESHTHRCLSGLREDQHRNRAYYRAQVALAQVAQGDIDQAVATASSVVAPTGAPGGRIGHLLRSFSSALQQAAPDSAATREWKDFVRNI